MHWQDPQSVLQCACLLYTSVIKDTVKEKNGRLLIGDVSAAEILSEDIFGTEISYNGLTVNIPLVGRHQVENTVGVITAARALGISDEFIKKGIESTVIHRCV